MKKSFSMIVIAALLLAGCSKSELTDREPSGALIKAKSAFPGVSGEATRAPYIGEISDNNKLVARVLTSKTDGIYNPTHANGQMTFGGSGAVGYDNPINSFDGNASFIANDVEPYFLVGLYPYADWAGDSDDTGETFTRGFDGNDDLMAAAQQQTSYTATIVEKNPPTLTFKHLLTKLEVSVKAKEAASLLKWGKIKSIILATIGGATPAKTIIVTLADGSAASTAFIGDLAGPFDFYGFDSNGAYTEDKFAYTEANTGIDLSTTAAKVAYSLIPPYVNTDESIVLEFDIVTEKGGTVQSDVTLPVAGYTQGRAYGITFTFDAIANPIQSSAIVIDWQNVGSKEVDVH
jgi:hypothetical protein